MRADLDLWSFELTDEEMQEIPQTLAPPASSLRALAREGWRRSGGAALGGGHTHDIAQLVSGGVVLLGLLAAAARRRSGVLL